MMARLLTTLLLGSCLFAGHSVAATLEIAQTSSKPEAEFRLEPYRKTIALRGKRCRRTRAVPVRHRGRHHAALA
jgi:hypothetical protein